MKNQLRKINTLITLSLLPYFLLAGQRLTAGDLSSSGELAVEYPREAVKSIFTQTSYPGDGAIAFSVQPMGSEMGFSSSMLQDIGVKYSGMTIEQKRAVLVEILVEKKYERDDAIQIVNGTSDEDVAYSIEHPEIIQENGFIICTIIVIIIIFLIAAACSKSKRSSSSSSSSTTSTVGNPNWHKNYKGIPSNPALRKTESKSGKRMSARQYYNKCKAKSRKVYNKYYKSGGSKRSYRRRRK